MASNDAFKRYLELGAALTAVGRARAEEMVQELARGGMLQGAEAQAKLDELIDRGRKGSEAVVAVIRDEVSSQLQSRGISSLEDVARQVATLLGRSGEGPDRSTDDVGEGAPTPAATKVATEAVATATKPAAPAERAAAKAATQVAKVPAKKASAKKAGAKKGPVTRVSTKKAPTKKAGAKKGPVTRVSTKKAPAKAAGRTAPAKRAAKRAPAPRTAAPAPTPGQRG